MTKQKAEEIVRLLFQTAPPFRRNYLKPTGRTLLPRLPHHHMFCLIILRESGRVSMSALAEKLGVSNQQLTRIVNELVCGGYAERISDEANRRIVYIAATEKGLKLLSLHYRLACREIEQHLSSLTDEEADAFIYHLSALSELFKKMES